MIRVRTSPFLRLLPWAATGREGGFQAEAVRHVGGEQPLHPPTEVAILAGLSSVGAPESQILQVAVSGEAGVELSLPYGLGHGFDS